MCQVNPNKASKENTTILCFCMLKQCMILSRHTKQSQLFGTSHHSLYDHLVIDFVLPLYALISNVLSLCMIMAIIALLVGRSQSFASFHNQVWVPLMHPTPKTKLFQRVHHTYLLAYAIPSIFMFLSTFQIKLVMRKLVIKALTNLMAHFTFLHLINLNHCIHLCCVYACYL